jgi:hypothetical protein
MKTLITYSILFLGLFGIVRAEETAVEVTESVVSISGELSTDITFGDATTFSSPYTGLVFSGDGWVVSTNLTDGMVNIEEAKYIWNVVDGVSLTFGSQAEPYGLAWGLHRPSNNWFVSTPRDHVVTNGVGVGFNKWGVGADLFWGGDSMDEEMESELYWAGRFSYDVNLLGIDSNVGLSLNSNEAQLLDVSVNSGMFETSLEYDLSEEADGAYWMRGVVTPPFGQGAFLLIGLNSDEVVTYGVGYKCSDNMKVMSEFTSGMKDTDGNEVENDFSIRASYSF